MTKLHLKIRNGRAYHPQSQERVERFNQTLQHQLAKEIEAGLLSSSEITAEMINNKLSFADLPDPDLFIRTSGELRISNFMLWQLAYSELYFTPVLWPDFNDQELEKALTHYANRERRFGSSQ